MAMMLKKPDDIKYTDMCIWIDANMSKLSDPNCPEEISSKIFNYLWLLCKALAIKKRMFNSAKDYDGYSFYSANRLYFALKKNLENSGKIIKGKEIRPIKSCLNYTKALLYPMKIEYLREEYNAGANETKIAENFDPAEFKRKTRENIWHQQGGEEEFKLNVYDVFKRFKATINKVLLQAPFKPDSLEYKYLKVSLLLNILMNLKQKKGLGAEPITVIFWKLPKTTNVYIKLFLKRISIEFKKEIIESYNDSMVEDKILDYMLSNPEGEFIDREDQY